MKDFECKSASYDFGNEKCRLSTVTCSTGSCTTPTNRFQYYEMYTPGLYIFTFLWSWKGILTDDFRKLSEKHYFFNALCI